MRVKLTFPASVAWSNMNYYVLQSPALCKARMSRVLLIGMIASVTLVFQTFTLSPLFPAELDDRSLPNTINSPKSMKVGKFFFLSDSQKSTDLSTVLEESKYEISSTTGEADPSFRIREIKGNTKNDGVDLDEIGVPGGKFPLGLEYGHLIENADVFAGEQDLDANNNNFPDTVRELQKDFEHIKMQGNIPVVSNDLGMSIVSVVPLSAKDSVEVVDSSGEHANITFGHDEDLVLLQSGSATADTISIRDVIPLVKKKKPVMPPIYFSEMNRLLLRNRAAYHSMRPRWSSERDKEVIAAKAQIERPPIVKSEEELYAPLFRNISTFKRSYELMEKMLKIYIYKDGRKPIFHQPLLNGIYASEGWFIKLMEENRQYVVKDPRRAHLFYMPFSSRYLQFALYVPNSHSKRNLEQYLKNYVDLLARNYPFWNRTGGADHFLVACHDWAAYETRHAMKRSIRSLCNSDLHSGFQLGKDVSLPTTYLRSPRNPLKDIGGRPADRRPILAFFAGNMHGSLRTILVQHWENKDPDMKIFGPMPVGVKRKMNYAQHMKSSKYCICPKGYEVNSPRVVESIFYECVPVLVSDNYVPPFFDVLNWEAFSVILPEKDVPRLKEILQAIPEEKYLALQKGVRKVQQHFLWHNKPEKYDLFHMILHSIWFNRVFQIRTR